MIGWLFAPTPFATSSRDEARSVAAAVLRICAFKVFAAALGELARTHMEPDLAAMVLDGLGLSVADLEAAGADAHDLEPLRRRQWLSNIWLCAAPCCTL